MSFEGEATKFVEEDSLAGSGGFDEAGGTSTEE